MRAKKLLTILLVITTILTSNSIAFASEEGPGTDQPENVIVQEEMTEEEADESSSGIIALEGSDEESVSVPEKETKISKLTYQEIEASVYKDASLTEEEKDIQINLSGELPAGTYVTACETPAVSDAGETIFAYDISLLNENGEEFEPDQTVTVDVSFENGLDDISQKDLSVIHITDNGKTEEIRSFEKDGDTIRFDADSFSVYEIVIVGREDEEHGTISDLSEIDGKEYYLSVTKNNSKKTFYFADYISDRNKIGKTSANAIELAAKWHFTQTEEGSGQFKLSTTNENGTFYMCMDDNGNMSLSEEDGTAFTVEKYSSTSDKFYIYHQTGNKKYGLNMLNGENGKGFGGWTGKDDGSAITFTNIPEEKDDPLGLDGKSYALVNQKNGNAGVAMMGEQKSNTHLEAQTAICRLHPGINEDVFVSKETDLTLWTFENITGNQYYITTTVEGATKYLRVTSNAVTLADSPDENCKLYVTAGTGTYEGKIRISNATDYAPNLYSGSVTKGFGSYNDGQENEWFRLGKTSDLSEEDFVIYTARKMSISDTENVKNGSKIIVYTRKWNDTLKKYEYFAIDHDGKTVPCYESGDSIEWIGSRLNTMLWDFTEYYYEGTTDPNYYYELYNEYSQKYIAPQIGNGTPLSDNKIGINLNGRRYNDYYSTIMAWDDPYYAYAGVKIEDDRIVSCPISQAEDFYFAVLDEPEEQTDGFKEIPTLDSEQYGVSMKLVNFPSNTGQNSFLGSSAGGSVKTTVPDLLSTDLGEDGYPTNKNGVSLQTLFADAEDVNHLFIESTHSGTGYFEFDSTQNFASLKENGDFKVYRELGTHDEGTQNALSHGQFLPYNDITPDVYATKNAENIYDAEGRELPESAPRKYEKLYLTENPDFYFGMEISASFVQTPSGQDAWGHDIIYEFTGDDDFWLYVDGELVIDLGGIHAALPGSVNYCTGEVNVNGKHTTLYEIFHDNYKKRNPEATESEISEYLDGIFELNDNGQYVFKDYSTHTMKIFFMERGAGASNLHMRFNLSSVKPGQVELSKQISGTEKQDYRLAEYAYQIYYQIVENGPYIRLNEETATGSNINVTYQNTTIPVKYKETYTPAGGSVSYEDVYFLTPQQNVMITFPDDAINYYIKECGVNQQVYDEVKINDDVTTGVTNGNRKDYASEPAKVNERLRMVFDNHVKEDAFRTLTITKRLYDISGNEITDDPTEFQLRLYLGNENESEIKTASYQEYCIKAPNGDYCYWDHEHGRFCPIGKSDYEDLTEDEIERITYQTSMNGAVSKFPAGYKVEVRDLLVGTKFKVEERENEIPIGYSFIEYERDGASYIIEDGDTLNAGIIRENESPAIEVHNRRGFCISATKEWSDKTFMESHDDIYVAVYVNGILLEDSVRAITNDKLKTQYYWDALQAGTSIADYEIREVKIEGTFNTDPDTNVITLGPNAVVTPYAAGDTISINGKASGEAAKSFDYKVSYVQGGVMGEAQNIREDTVKNTRRGIKLIKTDYSGNALEGARFTITDPNGNVIGDATYTSGESGLITTAYVNTGIVYTVTETGSPAGYQGLSEPVRFKMKSDGEITMIDGPEDSYTVAQGDENEMPSISLKDKTFTLEVKKTDKSGDPSRPLAGAHFAVYREVTVNGQTRMDYVPISGMSDLISGSDGILPGINESLPKGAYYIKETEAPKGYELLKDAIRFEITDTGYVLLDRRQKASLIEDDTQTGCMRYTIAVENRMQTIIPTGILSNHRTALIIMIICGIAATMLYAMKRKNKKQTIQILSNKQ